MSTDNLRTQQTGLPLLAPAQGLRYVTLNEALNLIDSLLQLSVDGVRSEPPATTEDQAYIVGPNATGAFANHDGKIALYRNGSPVFHVPEDGWLAYDKQAKQYRTYTNQTWQLTTSDQQDKFGVNTTSDMDNRLAVASHGVLFTHETDNIQVKLNKATSEDVASVIFQTDYSTRAEIGTIEDEGLRVKVSPDGSNFLTAAIIDENTGIVDFPEGAREAGNAILNTNYTPDLLSYKGTIANAVDLDTMRETGLFLQQATAYAQNGQNYPVGDAGLLTVVEALNMTFQTYQVFSASVTHSNGLFVRGRYNSTWSAWRSY